VKPWVIYSLYRVGIFAAAFAVLVLVGFEPWIAAIVAAIIGFCVSYLFLREARDKVAEDVYSRRHAPDEQAPTTPGSDEEAEDR
jgi:uncharacterized membrane protein YphA (DoxX/SURF4 family)